MIAGLSLSSEFTRLSRHRITRVSIAVIVLLPLLYGALYLWAFFNPFGNLSQMPIALVNSDRGAVSNGERVNAGEQVTQGLLEADQLTWTVSSPEEAREGVANGRFYFALEIPENFTEAVTSPGTDNPQQARIRASFNDANGYLSTIIGENAMRELLNQVNVSISSEAVGTILVGLVDAGAGISRAADGAGQIHDGATELDAGAGRLNAGAAELTEGATRAHAGSVQLDNGAGELKDGTARLNEGLGTLRSGTTQLGDGAGQVADGVDTLVTQLQQITTAQTTATQPLLDLANSLDLGDPATQRLAAQLRDIHASLNAGGLGENSTVAADLTRLKEGSRELANQLSAPDSQYLGGINQLVDGAGQLDAGAGRLKSGTTELSAGLGELEAGTVRLQDGTGDLNAGTTRLVEGSDQLATQLREGSDQVPKWDQAQRDRRASVIGGPVAIDTTEANPTSTFGVGMAPFFFALSLFIGAIITWMIFRPLQSRPITAGLSGLRTALASYVPALFIAIGQAVALLAVSLYLIGVTTANTLGLFLVVILVAAMSMAVTQAINALLGPGPGRVVNLAFLMLQLVGSGGLYPIETQPQLLQWFHVINPMTYSVVAIRQVLTGAMDARFGTSVLVIVLVLALALTVTSLCARRDRLWTIEGLHPPLRL